MTLDRATDKEFLTKEEYGTDQHLSTRIRTHKQYTQPKRNFANWVLDHVPWRGAELVLDIGCGAGMYLEPVLARLTGGGRLLAGDISAGMLRDLSSKGVPAGAMLLNADAMCLPLTDQSCDVVMANHMLYHVPEIGRAVVEVKRVLRPAGFFLAVTNSNSTMQALLDEINRAIAALGFDSEIPNANAEMKFRLEDGADWIKPVFPNVQVSVLDSALVFPAAEPVLAYVDSLRGFYSSYLPKEVRWENLLQQLSNQIEGIIDTAGEFRVPKTTGVFVVQY